MNYGVGNWTKGRGELFQAEGTLTELNYVTHQ